MINAVGREIPEEVLKATGKEAFKGAYAYDNYEYTKAAPKAPHHDGPEEKQDRGEHP